MQYYWDICVLDDPDFPAAVLFSALYNKFHRALVELQLIGQIAVSFPQYCMSPKTLGHILRLHGSQQALSALMHSAWLIGMRDHITQTEIQAIPATTSWIQVSRVQAKSNVARLRDRFVRRHQVSDQEAAEKIPVTVEKQLKLPFVGITSQSTHQRFLLFIRQDKATQENQGTFNSYGLSQSATLPWFDSQC